MFLGVPMREDQPFSEHVKEMRPKLARAKTGFLTSWLSRKSMPDASESDAAGSIATETDDLFQEFDDVDKKFGRFSLPWHQAFEWLDPEIIKSKSRRIARGVNKMSTSMAATDPITLAREQVALSIAENFDDIMDSDQVFGRPDSHESDQTPGAPTKGYKGELWVYHDDTGMSPTLDYELTPDKKLDNLAAKANMPKTDLVAAESVPKLTEPLPDVSKAPIEKAYELSHETKTDDTVVPPPTAPTTVKPASSYAPSKPTAYDPAAAYYLPPMPTLRMGSPFVSRSTSSGPDYMGQSEQNYFGDLPPMPAEAAKAVAQAAAKPMPSAAGTFYPEVPAYQPNIGSDDTSLAQPVANTLRQGAFVPDAEIFRKAIIYGFVGGLVTLLGLIIAYIIR